jgi:hypothetical protein
MKAELQPENELMLRLRRSVTGIVQTSRPCFIAAQGENLIKI